MTRKTSGNNPPLWLQAADNHILYPPIMADSEADVCVIGGGIAGLSTAYLLAREGSRVALLEDGFIGSGETGRTTAHLSNALDDRYYELERLHGRAGARLAAESHTAAIDTIDAIIQQENIQCDGERVDAQYGAPHRVALEVVPPGRRRRRPGLSRGR